MPFYNRNTVLEMYDGGSDKTWWMYLVSDSTLKMIKMANFVFLPQ